MKNIRIIPRLDIKGPNLVKGVHLEGLRVMGRPEDFAERYYNEGADELIYIDVVASLYGRNNLTEILKRTSERIFVPMTAGGGIRTLEDINTLLRAGADKVAINTAAIRNPRFVRDAAKTFGSQCIVVSIHAKLGELGKYEALTDCGRELTGKDVFEWAKEAVDLGAGELLITSVDREGTGGGYDTQLIKRIASATAVPVIACGGAGRLEDFSEAVKEGSADALSAASVFHYYYLQVLHSVDRFKDEGNVEFIRQARGPIAYLKGRILPNSISAVKDHLKSAGISCRTAQGIRLESERLNV